MNILSNDTLWTITYPNKPIWIKLPLITILWTSEFWLLKLLEPNFVFAMAISEKSRCFLLFDSPPARWGLLDFMSTPAPSPSPPPPPPPRRTSTTMITPECSLPDLNHDHPRPVFAAGPQPRPATPSVRCRTSTTTIHAQCSLPDLNHDQPRPVFAAGPQPRPATSSVRCRTSTTTSHAQCSLPDLNSYAKSYAR